MVYKVTEIFRSIQGEGYHVGRVAIFIRLSGCNLNCSWCDTSYLKFSEYHTVEIVDEVLELIEGDDPLIVITGGEPTIQPLNPLCEELTLLGKATIAIETNTTNMKILSRLKACGLVDWITGSPKKQPELEYGEESVFSELDEIKIIYPTGLQPLEFEPFIPHLIKNRRAYIQPCSQNFEAAVEFVKQNPQWRLSIQIQKILGVR